MSVQKTYYPKADELSHEWYVVDASGMNLGRLATRVASTLLGKGKPTYTPGVDLGDFVIVTNAAKITVTGKKLDNKIYFRHSGYPGGVRKVTLRDQLARFPERVVQAAVWGMLPHNRMGRKLLRKLKVYGGTDHPHQAQNPKPLA
ncbi:MAG: 50S ribosomal protein L13 [Chloroflexi bacterium RBG_13_68_17]|nr:MAG: 50S ribosomal protein L13 [Chloroflexi bacterium RBG_13_68_17]